MMIIVGQNKYMSVIIFFNIYLQIYDNKYLVRDFRYIFYLKLINLVQKIIYQYWNEINVKMLIYVFIDFCQKNSKYNNIINFRLVKIYLKIRSYFLKVNNNLKKLYIS